jgi:hypothetical protein
MGGHDMRKLFYRVASCRLSIMAVAVVAFAALELFTVQQVLAGTKCCIGTSCYCDSTASICNSGYTSAGTCTTTRTGGTSGSGSNWSAVIQFGEESVQIIGADPPEVPPAIASQSVCGAGFFDVKVLTQANQAASCLFTPTGGNPQEAQCVFTDLQCSCFKIEQCSTSGPTKGFVTHSMTCPTNNPTTGLNAAGCTGSVEIRSADGSTVLETVAFGGADLAQLNTNAECGATEAFPAAFGLKKGVMGTITQQCTAGSPLVTNPVVKQVVRSTNNYASTTEWVDEYPATCTTNNGFPRHSCTNSSATWVTVLNPNPAGNAAACVAARANLSCGQAPDGSPGPAPTECRLDSAGQCQCRCVKCDAATGEPLVNAGLNDQGKYVLGSLSVAPIWVAACPVTTTE